MSGNGVKTDASRQTPSAQQTGEKDAGERAAAGVLAYAIALALFTKLTRAGFLWHATGSPRVWYVLPLVLAQDVVFVTGCALVTHALVRIHRRSLPIGIGVILLEALIVIHIFDIGAYELIGAPLTFPRIFGEDGGTVADLDLVSKRDLGLGIGAILLWSALIWPIIHYSPRWSALRRMAGLRTLVALLVLGLGGSFIQARLLRSSLGLDTQSAITLLASLVDKDVSDSTALSKTAWVRLLTPAMNAAKPEKRPIRLPAQRPKNVIVFLGEGIPYKHTGFSQLHRPDPTPRLTRRTARQGFVFTRFYAHWHASNQSIYSLVCSSLPPLGGSIMIQKPRIDCGEFSEVMHASGLHPGLFHGGRFSFYNKLALLGRRRYEVEQDAEGLIQNNPKWQATKWGTDDRAMVDGVLKWIDSLGKGSRFAGLLISIAPHYPFEIPDSWGRRPFKGEDELARYLNGVSFIDGVFEQVARGLEARSLLDDTLLVFLGDHGIAIGEPPHLTPGRRTFYESNLHIPLVLINPKLFPETLTDDDRRSDRVGGLMDLLPTVLDALGQSPDSRHHGQSLFNDQGWPRRSFFAGLKGRFVGFVENDHKFIHEVSTGRSQFYDLVNDPDEQNDLSGRFSERMKQYGQDAVTIANGLRSQISLAPVLDEKVSLSNLYQLFPKNVKASIELAGERNDCLSDPTGNNRVCGALGSLFRETSEIVQGRRRHCLWVRVPEKAVVRLRITDPTTLSLLTSIFATVADKQPVSTQFRIETDVDGQAKPVSFLKADNAKYVAHRRASHYLEYAISRTHQGNPDQLCLQLSTVRD